jgi:hypothetical protein
MDVVDGVSLGSPAAPLYLSGARGGRHIVVKVIALCPQRKDISREDFEKYMRETHVPLLAMMRGCGGWF